MSLARQQISGILAKKNRQKSQDDALDGVAVSNHYLQYVASKNFIEEGKENFDEACKQFIFDVIRGTLVDGKKFLGLELDTIISWSNQTNNLEIQNQILIRLKSLLKISVEQARSMIMAHSQGPAAFIPSVLGQACTINGNDQIIRYWGLPKVYNLVLLTLDENQEVDLYDICKKHDYSPILIKQNNKVFLYGYSQNQKNNNVLEWHKKELSDLSEFNFAIHFPEKNDEPVSLANTHIPNDLLILIGKKEAHVAHPSFSITSDNNDVDVKLKTLLPDCYLIVNRPNPSLYYKTYAEEIVEIQIDKVPGLGEALGENPNYAEINHALKMYRTQEVGQVINYVKVSDQVHIVSRNELPIISTSQQKVTGVICAESDWELIKISDDISAFQLATVTTEDELVKGLICGEIYDDASIAKFIAEKEEDKEYQDKIEEEFREKYSSLRAAMLEEGRFHTKPCLEETMKLMILDTVLPTPDNGLRISAINKAYRTYCHYLRINDPMPVPGRSKIVVPPSSESSEEEIPSLFNIEEELTNPSNVVRKSKIITTQHTNATTTPSHLSIQLSSNAITTQTNQLVSKVVTSGPGNNTPGSEEFFEPPKPKATTIKKPSLWEHLSKNFLNMVDFAATSALSGAAIGGSIGILMGATGAAVTAGISIPVAMGIGAGIGAGIGFVGGFLYELGSYVYGYYTNPDQPLQKPIVSKSDDAKHEQKSELKLQNQLTTVPQITIKLTQQAQNPNQEEQTPKRKEKQGVKQRLNKGQKQKTNPTPSTSISTVISNMSVRLNPTSFCNAFDRALVESILNRRMKGPNKYSKDEYNRILNNTKCWEAIIYQSSNENRDHFLTICNEVFTKITNQFNITPIPENILAGSKFSHYLPDEWTGEETIDLSAPHSYQAGRTGK